MNPDEELAIELSMKKLLNRVQEQESERTNACKGSLQPEAEGSPAPEVAEAASFERSVTRRPTVSSHYVDTSLKVGFGQERCANNALLLTLV